MSVKLSGPGAKIANSTVASALPLTLTDTWLPSITVEALSSSIAQPAAESSQSLESSGVVPSAFATVTPPSVMPPASASAARPANSFFFKYLFLCSPQCGLLRIETARNLHDRKVKIQGLRHEFLVNTRGTGACPCQMGFQRHHSSTNDAGVARLCLLRNHFCSICSATSTGTSRPSR